MLQSYKGHVEDLPSVKHVAPRALVVRRCRPSRNNISYQSFVSRSQHQNMWGTNLPTHYGVSLKFSVGQSFP